jgi:hypothetical protein
MDTYQAILDEGRADEAQQFLLRLAKKQLGEPPAQVLNAIKAIENYERLEMAGERHNEVSSWEQFLTIL